jgi:hypothetical protein
MTYAQGKRQGRETHDLPNEQEDADPNNTDGGEGEGMADDACISIIEIKVESAGQQAEVEKISEIGGL